MATEETPIAGVWVKHPKSGVVSYVVHPDTIARCRMEGFAFVPDPRLPVAPQPDPALPAEASAPSPVVAAPGSLTIVADTPAELTAALESAQAHAVRERNTAARTAFGIETPPQPVVKPATVRKAGQHANPA